MKSSRTVLIVEDNSAIAEMMNTLLVMEGYQVIVAKDGQQAIDALRTQTLDVIILDMMMPGVNGWHFLDFQRARPGYAKIPVIVVSAFGEIAKSVHPAFYLPKPLKMEQLLEAVQKCSA